jgi:hypothetical protein
VPETFMDARLYVVRRLLEENVRTIAETAPDSKYIGNASRCVATHHSARLCALPECGSRFTPNHERQTYCSPKCRFKAWDARNPRQRPLDFARPAAPAVGTPAQREQSAALDRRESKKAALLALLRRGPAKTWDMMLVGGSGWRSRKYELQQDGYGIHVEEHSDYAVYTLVGEP